MKRRTALLRLLAVLGTAGLLVMLLLTALRDRPLPEAAPHAFTPPASQSAPTFQACWIEYGRNETFRQVATAGFTRSPGWSVTIAGLLVRHPKGDLVIDVGNSSSFASEIEEYPLAMRAWLKLLPGSNQIVATAPDALRAAGVDLERLTVLPSHAHADHIGGLVDLPKARVLLAREELEFSRKFTDQHGIHVVAAHARSFVERAAMITFEPRPYENFDESADLFGDGSVVVVKLFGHTPGSVGIFVNVDPQHRVFHVGDTVNVVEAIERRLTKSVVMTSTDLDHQAADHIVSKLAQLHEKDPTLIILPAHDRLTWGRTFGEPGRCLSSPRSPG